MELKIYKMNFRNAHFGDGYLNTSLGYFKASRLFSALFLEALKNECAEEFLALAQEDSFVLSDAFPYTDEPYLPLPVGYPAEQPLAFDTLKADLAEKRLLEKLYAIPYSHFNSFLERKEDLQALIEEQESMYQVNMLTKKGIDPYEVAVTTFDSSLYVLASSSKLFNSLMKSLQYSGLGGKRSSGYGSFDLEILSLPKEIASKINTNDARRYLLLTSSLPKNDELNGVLNASNYRLEKDSGFVYSTTAGQPLRKNDIFKFAAGSVFLKKFKGSIQDVAPENFEHPVYNFSKGLFFGF